MYRAIRLTFLALLVLGGVFVGCSDDATAPAVCDESNPGGFSIDSPERGRVYAWGGTGKPGAGQMGQLPGDTKLYWPTDVCFDPDGNPIVLDWNNHRVLQLDGTGKFVKMIGRYFGNPSDGPALEADLNHPTHVCFSPDGTKLYLSAWHNSIVMEMDLATGWVARYAGTGARNFNGDGLPRLSTVLDLPVATVFHPVTGELYIADQANMLVRKVDGSGNVVIVAGTAPVSNGTGGWNYQAGFSGDNGPATAAMINLERTQTADPSGKICFDADGNLYIADTLNNAVRKVSYPGGIITTVAGNPVLGAGFSGDDGPGGEAQLNQPRDVATDVDGNLFIADSGNHVIRKVALDGTISTVVGKARPFDATAITACALEGEQGAAARDVHLAAPRGVALDSGGNLWISDTHNEVIRILYR